VRFWGKESVVVSVSGDRGGIGGESLVIFQATRNGCAVPFPGILALLRLLRKTLWVPGENAEKKVF